MVGLPSPTASLMNARFPNPPIPIGQDLLIILLPYMPDRSIITHCAPANCDTCY